MPSPSQIAPDSVFALVQGVHRSGTSLLAAGLEHLGCDLGEFDDLPNPENPKGFFEHPGFRVFNDQILEELGASWDNWCYRADEDFSAERFAEQRQEAGALLHAELGGRPAVALKDPRMSTLAPFWDHVFAEQGLRPRRILVLRDPREVARSQAIRAEANPGAYRLLPTDLSMHALWCATMEIVLKSVPDEGVFLVTHKDLFTRPEESLRQIAAYLDLPAPEDRIAAFASSFVDPALHRSKAPEAELDHPLAQLSGAIFHALTEGPSMRLVMPDEAQALLAGLPELALLHAMQDVVGPSFQRSAARQRVDAARISRLRQTVNLFAAIATRDGAARALEQRLPQLEKLVAQDRHDMDVILMQRAAVAERLGEPGKAKALYRKISKAVPGAPAPLASLIRLLRNAGQTAEARKLQEDGKSRFPNHPAFKG